MADINRLEIPARSEELLLVGTGGTVRTRAEFRDGQRTGETMKRGGADVHRLTGLAVSLAGVGLDGATVETASPLDEVPAGQIFRAEGEVSVAVRADARPGFGDSGPRGVLGITVWVERLTPVGDVAALLTKSAPPQRSAKEAS